MASFRGWVSRRIIEPITVQLRQGLSPERLSASLALGLACALFPVFGATTTLCLLVGVPLKLNQPTMQIVNHVAGPLQVALMIPFIRLGETLFRAPRLPLSATQILDALRADPVQSLS